METQKFGDQHTLQKLQTVEKYLKAYTTALKKQSFELLYIDACAGSGSSAPKNLDAPSGARLPFDELPGAFADADQIIMGSAIRALSVETPFDRYYFNDLKEGNVSSLNDVIGQRFAHLKSRVSVTKLDANDMISSLCKSTNWKNTRAVVFLDPFGLQIDYSTLEILGKTGAVDLWYLVPVFAMYRQVSGDGQIHPDGGPRVDAALGTDAWRRTAVVEEMGTDLFQHAQLRSRRAVDIAWFEKVAKERIGRAFGGRVLSETLALGRNGIQEFSLMFAWANPSERARLAAKLAKAVLA